MRRFVVVGQTASASPDFSVEDLPGTGGRIDVLLRCVRAALLFSHGVRVDTRVYLCLLGGPRAPRTLRFDGAEARFLRPDERSLGTLVKKTLAAPSDIGPGFVPVRHGVAMSDGGLDVVIADLGGAWLYVLERGAPDLRAAALDESDCAFFLGDHLGLDAASRETLAARRAVPIGLGPVDMHAEDAVAVVVNELDRRGA
jgi:tRNA (pseudouridine54-N1)-methyltransferase